MDVKALFMITPHIQPNFINHRTIRIIIMVHFTIFHRNIDQYTVRAQVFTSQLAIRREENTINGEKTLSKLRNGGPCGIWQGNEAAGKRTAKWESFSHSELYKVLIRI